MSALSIRLPASLHDQLRDVAAREGVSINQYVLMSVTERLARSDDYLTARAARSTPEKFAAALDMVPDGPPIEGDELP